MLTSGNFFETLDFRASAVLGTASCQKHSVLQIPAKTRKKSIDFLTAWPIPKGKGKLKTSVSTEMKFEKSRFDFNYISSYSS